METTRLCGCKGCRTCLLCEHEYGIHKPVINLKAAYKSYVYCPWCEKAWPGWDLNQYLTHPNHEGTSFNLTGVKIVLDFITQEEESKLLEDIESLSWVLSQSGRRKINFGPKCNFKKQKLNIGTFKGFPKFSKFIQDRFENVELLKNFITIEQCFLEYDPVRGASIDPHVDDCWIWGERIITMNLLSDSILTLTKNSKPNYYNLDQVKEYSSVISQTPYILKSDADIPNDVVIRIPMPKRSLLILYGEARYDCEHQVLREDIYTKRICIAYREFVPPYLSGGERYSDGKPVIEFSSNYF